MFTQLDENKLSVEESNVLDKIRALYFDVSFETIFPQINKKRVSTMLKPQSERSGRDSNPRPPA